MTKNYFTRLLEGRSPPMKPQYVDTIPNAIKGTVGTILRSKDERGIAEVLFRELQVTFENSKQ